MRLPMRRPAWHARLAGFLMHDPLRARREDLQRLYADLRRRTRSARCSTPSLRYL
jgi:hypothetical protein